MDRGWSGAWVSAPGQQPAPERDTPSGTWELAVRSGHLDRAWDLVQRATVEGRLGVAAGVGDPGGGDGTILVLTADREDRADVARVLRELRAIGVRRALRYTPGRSPGGEVLYRSAQDTEAVIDLRVASPARSRAWRPPAVTGEPLPIGGVPIAVVDVETTGLGHCPPQRVVEIGVVRLAPDGTTVEATYGSLVRPGCGIDWRSSSIHGITDTMVAAAPRFDAIAGDVADLLEGAVIGAHNAPFDLRFLRGEFELAGAVLPDVPVLCTQRLTRQLHPALDSYRLEACCSAFGIDLTGAHAAVQDATATARLLAVHLGEATRRGLRCLRELGTLGGAPLRRGWATWRPAGAPLPR